MNRTTRVHCKKAPFDVYIGRPMPEFPQGSIWANPFRIGPDGSRQDVIRKFREWLPTQPHLMARLSELKGQRLGCWCDADCDCHGDVYIELLEPDLKKPEQIALF